MAIDKIKVRLKVSIYETRELVQILQRHFPGEANKRVELEASSGWSQLATLPAKAGTPG